MSLVSYFQTWLVLFVLTSNWILPLEFGFQMEELLPGIGGWELKLMSIQLDTDLPGRDAWNQLRNERNCCQ